MKNRKCTASAWHNVTYGQCYAFLRCIAVLIVLLAFFVLTIKAFTHVHLEIEVPEHVWEQMEKEDRKQADDKVQNDPDNASQSDWDKSCQHREEHTV